MAIYNCCNKITNEEICAECMKRKKEIADAFEKAERNMNNGVKIPVISMEDVPKIMEEMEK